MRYCLFPNCNMIVDKGYCEVHARYKSGEENRPSAHKRGYSRKWKKVRDIKLKRNPLCEMCEERNKITPADMVHHIKPISEGGAVLEYDNLMSLCNKCHGEVHNG